MATRRSSHGRTGGPLMVAHIPRAIDARHVPLTRAQRLAQDATAAAELRAWQTHPDVVALRTERVRSQVDALIWIAVVAGLSFTMVNVQTFAAAGAPRWSLPWCVAWLLDPMVSLVLIAVLRAEQVTARWQVDAGPWTHRTKWATFAATYAMNTWASWAAGSLSGIVLHSVPPTLVAAAAATAPRLRDALTEAVTRAGATVAQVAATHSGSTDDARDANQASDGMRTVRPRPRRTKGARSDGELRSRAAQVYRDACAAGERMTGTQLAERFGRSPRWGQQIKAAIDNGTNAEVAA